jgi:hypothetical protein
MYAGRLALAIVLALCVTVAANASVRKHADPPPGHTVFMTEAVENNDLTQVTLPAYRGSSGGQPVWYVVTDASSQTWANALGANYAPKLANAAPAAMPVSFTITGLDFPATVDFSPKAFIDKGDYGDCPGVPFLPFGKKCFGVGAVGGSGYTPLIKLPDGTVLNAPQIANASGQSDKIVKLEAGRDDLIGHVTLHETTGLYDEHTVHYLSFDASIPPAAVLEDSTLAPHLNDTLNDVANDNTNPATTSRNGLIAFTNGQLHKNNPNHQGLNSRILDDTFPLNILQFIPDDAEGIANYSPIWDVHLATWKSSVPVDQRTRQDEFEQTEANTQVTQPDGTSPLKPSGFEVNCPIVSTDPDGVIFIPGAK